MRLICIAQAERMVAKLTNGGDEAFALCQREAHTLILCEWCPKGLPFRDTGPALIKLGRRRRTALQADQGTAVIKALRDLHETHAFFAQKMARGEAYLIKKDRAAANGVAAQILEARGANARRIYGQQKSGNTVRAGFNRPGADKDQRRIRLIRHADRGFFDLDRERITITLRGKAPDWHHPTRHMVRSAQYRPAPRQRQCAESNAQPIPVRPGAR